MICSTPASRAIRSMLTLCSLVSSERTSAMTSRESTNIELATASLSISRCVISTPTMARRAVRGRTLLRSSMKTAVVVSRRLNSAGMVPGPSMT